MKNCEFKQNKTLRVTFTFHKLSCKMIKSNNITNSQYNDKGIAQSSLGQKTPNMERSYLSKA